MSGSTGISHIRELTTLLNRYRHEYYNLAAPSVSDEVYDRLFDELISMEERFEFILSDSPTQTVGYTVVSNLEKVRHEIPLLSLAKTKSVEALVKFSEGHDILLMLKLDGLTTKLTYEDGELVEAATRGDGDEGEIVTHNARAFQGVPLHVPYAGRLVVTGESIIRGSDFEALRGSLTDSTGEPYKNARNLAAGSVRLLDAAACRKRRISFLAFNVLEGLNETETLSESKAERLLRLEALGFLKCPSFLLHDVDADMLQRYIENLRGDAGRLDLPIDGIVASYNSVSFSKTCGRTGHHWKDGIAFKFEDDLFETILQYIEWTPTRSGEIAPVAVFSPVEIDGCEVSRASLHNLTFIEDLELAPGCRILVSKRNQIIPHVEENLDRGRNPKLLHDAVYPVVCPCCGEPTRIHESKADKNRTVKRLFCDNQDCAMQHLRQFVHFVGKKAMDIDGLSEATLEKLIGRGWLHEFMDLYRLDEHRADIIQMDGFGKRSWQRLWDAVQASRNTTFERYLISMDISMIGNTASKELCREFSGDLSAFEAAVDAGYDFTQLPDFGETLHRNIHDWFRVEDNRYLWEELQKMMNIEKQAPAAAVETGSNPFVGLTIVVTGKVEPYTRDSINAKIESLGAHAGSSVSKNTNYLICGENAGSKLSKARTLGVSVLTPAEFFRMAGE